MSYNECVNPECKKIYQVSESDGSMGTCSFDCWEKVYCGNPHEEDVGEKLVVPQA